MSCGISCPKLINSAQASICHAWNVPLPRDHPTDQGIFTVVLPRYNFPCISHTTYSVLEFLHRGWSRTTCPASGTQPSSSSPNLCVEVSRKLKQSIHHHIKSFNSVHNDIQIPLPMHPVMDPQEHKNGIGRRERFRVTGLPTSIPTLHLRTDLVDFIQSTWLHTISNHPHPSLDRGSDIVCGSLNVLPPPIQSKDLVMICPFFTSYLSSRVKVLPDPVHHRMSLVAPTQQLPRLVGGLVFIRRLAFRWLGGKSHLIESVA